MNHPINKLGFLIGNWQTTGKTVDGSGIVVKATDIYKWLEGQQFIIHRWDAKMGEGHSSGIELIGYDKKQEIYFAHSYDNEGNINYYTIEEQPGSWLFTSATDRSTLIYFPNNATMTGEWELPDGDNWTPWMNVTLTRADK